jgi:RNA polymerase sigma factor for flagellar operon FliA
MLPPWVEFDDILSAGMVGLAEASANYNPSRNKNFEGFAQFRIRGAILDSLRRSDWAPRDLRQKGRLLQEAICRLSLNLSRSPSEDEVATELKISLEEYQKLGNELAGLQIGSLNQMQDDGFDVEEITCISSRSEDDPLSRCMEGELRDKVARAIKNLSKEEQLVTTLYYYEELTQAEIASMLGMSERKIQQIRTSALRYLRAPLQKVSTIDGKHPMLVFKKRASTVHLTTSRRSAA